MLERLRRWWSRRPLIGTRLPRYDQRSTTIAGPFEARGDCFGPWLQAGDMFWSDRSLAPHDGDLVEARMWCAVSRPGLISPGRPKPTAEHRGVIKQYRRTEAGEFLVCNDGWYRLTGEHHVLGTIVGCARRNVRHRLADMAFPDPVGRASAPAARG